MKDTAPILTAKNLTIGYYPGSTREKAIAGPLNLDIVPGELICLLGPNGAGKSTLIRTLAGLQPMLQGSIQIEGKAIALFSPPEMARKVSMVLTEKVLSGNLNVYSLVSLGRFPYTGWLGNLDKHDREIIEWAMEATHTTHFASRKIDQLSDGERQKVMLARALAQDTPLIIMDEPTAHLDIPNRVELMRLLHQLAGKTQKAIMISTHELDLALQAADQVWLLQPDGLMDAGVPEDLVLDGRFEAAFNRESFMFDKANGMFRIHTESGQKLNLKGQGIPAFWTARALQREGYSVVEDNSGDFTVQVAIEDASCKWIVHHENHTKKCLTIAELLALLRERSAIKINPKIISTTKPFEANYDRMK